MSPHPLTNFEIEKYFKIEAKFNDIYSQNNLTIVKDGVYVTNLDEHESIGTH